MKHEWDYQLGGKTSVKIHNAPGGGSQWSIGWDDSQQQTSQQSPSKFQKGYSDQVQTYQSSYQKQSYDGFYGQVPQESVGYAGQSSKAYGEYQNPKAQLYQQQPSQYQQERSSAERTSVKVHAPPGGKSQFTFGFEDVQSFKPAALKQQDLNNGVYQQSASSKQLPTAKKGGYGSSGFESGYQQQQFQQVREPAYQHPTVSTYGVSGGKKQQQQRKDDSEPLFGGRHFQQQQQHSSSSYDQYSPQRQPYQPPRGGFKAEEEPTFGQRVQAGNNCGPTTDKSSVRLHAPPGGKSSITFF